MRLPVLAVSFYFVGNFEEISYRHGSCGRKLRLGLQRQRNFVLENEGGC